MYLQITRIFWENSNFQENNKDTPCTFHRMKKSKKLNILLNFI